CCSAATARKDQPGPALLSSALNHRQTLFLSLSPSRLTLVPTPRLPLPLRQEFCPSPVTRFSGRRCTLFTACVIPFYPGVAPASALVVDTTPAPPNTCTTTHSVLDSLLLAPLRLHSLNFYATSPPPFETRGRNNIITFSFWH
ncbi:hypothetical protein COCVIDRAFT_103397, partial [Bipolaris victoriae FI3]